MRKQIIVELKKPQTFKTNLLGYYKDEKRICLLESNTYRQKKHSKYDFVLATNSICELDIRFGKKSDPFEQMKSFQEEVNDWIFGHFSYDLKNGLEDLNSNNIDIIEAPLLSFFHPAVIYFLSEKRVEVSFLDEYYTEQEIVQKVNEIETLKYRPEQQDNQSVEVSSRIERETYFMNVNKIKNHIQLGDIYEMNYCQEFYGLNQAINPIETFLDLVKISPTPYSCYYKVGEVHLLCASPERFIMKDDNRIISQPIKGTIRRGKNAEEDRKLCYQLKNSEKDQSENVMIVDLVRNDLSKTAQKGSVKVEELFGIYAFEQVFHMISTITSEIDPNCHPIDVIRHAFPMGSMTGAPKIRAMKLIEHFETSKRGIYSGSVGYIDPDLNFDFNVIIRSILYNEYSKNLSYMVGGAITIDSDPEKEYEECMVKAKAIREVLKSEQIG